MHVYSEVSSTVLKGAYSSVPVLRSTAKEPELPSIKSLVQILLSLEVTIWVLGELFLYFFFLSMAPYSQYQSTFLDSGGNVCEEFKQIKTRPYSDAK